MYIYIFFCIYNVCSWKFIVKNKINLKCFEILAVLKNICLIDVIFLYHCTIYISIAKPHPKMTDVLKVDRIMC